jgi:hypothetical protein
MKRSAALFPIVLALGAIILGPQAGAQAQNLREEGPFEIEKCQTIDKPGSYKLVRNVVAVTPFSNTPCLAITANFVTIDLDGFSISTSVGAQVGIQALRPSSGQRLQGIVVRNGSISGFGNEVVLVEADGSIVEGLRVFGATGASFVGISANGIMRNNTVTNVTNGIGIEGTAVVTGNYASGNDTGIGINRGSTVIGNTATNNALVGISADCPSNITDNTAINNGTNVIIGSGCNNTNNVAP